MVAPSSTPPGSELPRHLDGLVFVTVHADQLSAAALSRVTLVIAVGEAPGQTIELFCRQTGRVPPSLPDAPPSRREALVWSVDTPEATSVPRPEPRGERRRHVRKYAEGQLGEDKSFYFRGPDNRLNLRAHNLGMFVQIAQGVDDATWLHHLQAGDYSRWFGEAIKDDGLAREVREAELASHSEAGESRGRILGAVERRYTGPASNR